ncbi:hypothetical protein JOD97_003020 [Duganella sp. 1411]|nr:hypothetical protein [Duganella sp. 1411]
MYEIGRMAVKGMLSVMYLLLLHSARACPVQVMA